MTVFSYRILVACLRNVTAYWGILAVFECPGLNFLEIAVEDGALIPHTLDIVHMDWSCACIEGMW